MLDPKIETFLAVVALGSYTAAGEQLHLTQPAVTGHIRRLEAYYGCLLIDSSKRSVRLTQAGARLYEYMRAQRANESQFMKSLAGLAVPLRIGSTLSIADYYLPEVLVRCLRQDETRFSVHVGNTSQLMEFLGNGTLDCAFVEGIFDSGLYDARIFRQAPFLPVAAASHPLAGKKIKLSDLHAYPLALREEGSGTREILSAILRHQNDSFSSFRIIAELGSFVLIKEFLASTQAVSFVYEAVARREVAEGKLIFLDLSDCAVNHPLHFLSRKGDSRKSAYEALYDEFMEL